MPTNCTRTRASANCPMSCPFRYETPEGRIRCLSPDKQRGKQAESTNSRVRCSHPRCRRPADTVISEDPVTRLIREGCPERGYCEAHNDERLEAAQRIYEEAHRAEIEAAKAAGSTGHS